MRKIFYVLLALFVLCAMSSAAFAADSEYSLWIKGQKSLAVEHKVTVEELERGEIVVTKELRAGDVDGNNKIDMDDYLLLLEVYGNTVPNVANKENTPEWKADCDNNGKVDMDDYLWLLENYGQSGDTEPK